MTDLHFIILIEDKLGSQSIFAKDMFQCEIKT